ncbi:hypothetical protein GobsT_44570 [Gemmata obscuriglobus]|uniref:Uncharacterized protein n=1 Tax=Gemmata obscuriglobus TaxID=114 RepID=A0A2Z3H1W3_9BACT|nr:hypothetical protein [Gemmata obscuriglobus]AWM37556.1 hypothetical protein C1280_11405 [Gemmata obscuriglobus]QEG29659.1 hypothetical protein GobsT_44570 [Gemmata obscuriglobus]VTS08976.1 unnamed protein product [Gemmata obscuriglobus UQM 2246]
MGDGKNRTAGRRAKFVFSYREHDVPEVWSDEVDGLHDAFASDSGVWGWQEQELPEGDLADSCDPGVRSIDDLVTVAREYFVAQGQQPEWLVRIPFDKLAVLMDRGGWSFLGGVFGEFVGNNSDTEIE